MIAKRPTLVGLAEASGFPVTLVSIATCDAPGVSAETRQRAKEVADRVGYQPNWLARGLWRSNSDLLGVSFAISHPFHANLVRHLYQASFGKDIDLVLSARLPGHLGERAAVTLLDKRCEAAILLGPAMPAEEAAALAGDTPVVAVTRCLEGISGVGMVRSGDRTDAAMAVDYLASLGHRRIAHVDGGTRARVPERRVGCCEAMVGRGLDFEIRVMPRGIEESDGYAATMAPFDSGPTPTGTPAFNDECATGVLSAATVLGCCIPEGLSAVGYDDSRRVMMTRVPLTSLAQTYEVSAMATIDRAITQTWERSEALGIIAQPELVVREPTGRALDSPGGN